MRIRIPAAAAAILLAAIVLSSCDPAVRPDAGNSYAANATPVGSDIAAATTWSAGKVYCIEGGIAVSATLTIEAGTVVKFGSSGKLTVGSGGSIVAIGRADAPIIFTSIRDKTNGDSITNDEDVAAAAGNWLGISISGDSSGNRFTYCEWRYAGGVDDVDRTAALRIEGVAAVDHCRFHDNLCGLPWITFQYAALDARGTHLGATSITDCIFYDNLWPLAVPYEFALGTSNTFIYDHDNNGATAPLGNRHQAIYLGPSMVGGSNTMSGSVKWLETEVPFCVFDTAWVYLNGAGNSLTVADNAVVKFGDPGTGLDIGDGATFSSGATTVFTSYKDDAHGGDSNADGAATAPAPNDWLGIDNDGINFTSGVYYAAY